MTISKYISLKKSEHISERVLVLRIIAHKGNCIYFQFTTYTWCVSVDDLIRKYKSDMNNGRN